MTVGVPDAEYVMAAGRQDAVNLAVGPLLSGKNMTPNWQTTASKAPAGNGSDVASAGRNSICSSGANFVRATSSIGGFRSVAVSSAAAGSGIATVSGGVMSGLSLLEDPGDHLLERRVGHAHVGHRMTVQDRP